MTDVSGAWPHDDFDQNRYDLRLIQEASQEFERFKIALAGHNIAERSRVGWHCFCGLRSLWKLTEDQQIQLLDIDADALGELNKNPPVLLTQKQLYIVAKMVNIYKNTHIYFGDDRANQIMQIPAGRYGGLSPVGVMCNGPVGAAEIALAFASLTDDGVALSRQDMSALFDGIFRAVPSPYKKPAQLKSCP